MDTVIPGAFYQTVSKVAFLPKDGNLWVEDKQGEKIRTLEKVQPYQRIFKLLKKHIKYLCSIVVDVLKK